MKEEDLIKVFGVWWEFGLLNDPDFGGAYYGLKGPYCASCYVPLEVKRVDASNNFLSTCFNCTKDYAFKENVRAMSKKAEDLYEARSRSLKDKVSLDEPPTKVSVRDSDENYFIAAKIGQKDGKRVGVVYFGERKDKQSKEDYSQIFIDLDDEQLRFDKSNKHPKEILLKFRAEFPDTTVDQFFKK